MLFRVLVKVRRGKSGSPLADLLHLMNEVAEPYFPKITVLPKCDADAM